MPYKFNVHVLGAIGSGKTEFAKALNAKLHGSLKLEKVMGNAFVEKMYDNPVEFAKILQMSFLFDIYKDSLDNTSLISVHDSGFPINKMFTERQVMNGVSTTLDKHVYDDIYKTLKREIEKECVSIFVVLNVDLEEVKRRIKVRDRAFEVEQDFEIFEANHKDANGMLVNFIEEFNNSHVIFVDNNDISVGNFNENIYSVSEEIMEIIADTNS